MTLLGIVRIMKTVSFKCHKPKVATNRNLLLVCCQLILFLAGCNRTSPNVPTKSQPTQPTVKIESPTPSRETQNSKPAITIEPASTLFDTPVNIQLSGFAPGQNVTVRMQVRAKQSAYFESWATFTTDNNGRVDLDVQQPITGTYTTVDGMGLFWSMVEHRDIDLEFTRDRLDPMIYDVTVESNEEIVASTQIERLIIDPEVVEIPIQDSKLVGTLYLPPGDGPHPVLIVLGGSEGGTNDSRAMLLASHGYAALALAYFGITPLPGSLSKIPLEYFEEAIAWLRLQSKVNVDKLGIVGSSRGGELALLLGSIFPEIKAIIAYSPSGIVFFDDAVEGGASWLYKGQPVPYVPPVWTDEFQRYRNEQTAYGKPFAYTPFYLDAMKDTSAVEQATIAVENIKGPILLISGEDDQVWPATLLSNMVIERLEQCHHPYPYEHISYPGTGHIIFAPYAPTTYSWFIHPVSGEKLLSGGNAEDTAFASVDSWTHTLNFLDTSLK